MIAWLGTALKSSQPSRRASCKSESPMLRTTGIAAVSGAGCASGVTLSEYGVVAMVVVSLDAPAGIRAGRGHARPSAENDHDQARREDRETKTGRVAN